MTVLRPAARKKYCWCDVYIGPPELILITVENSFIAFFKIKKVSLSDILHTNL